MAQGAGRRSKDSNHTNRAICWLEIDCSDLLLISVHIREMTNQPELKHQPGVRICLRTTEKSKDSSCFNVKSYGKIILQDLDV